MDNNAISFKFEHMGVPLSPHYTYTFGFYNFILPKGYKFTKLRIVDPYNKEEKINDKREFCYNLKLDKELDIQLIEMELRSRRDTFSFIVAGEAKLSPLSYDNTTNLVEYQVCEHLLNSDKNKFKNFNNFSNKFIEEINRVFDLKPNFFGVGVNFNAIYSLRN